MEITINFPISFLEQGDQEAQMLNGLLGSLGAGPVGSGALETALPSPSGWGPPGVHGAQPSAAVFWSLLVPPGSPRYAGVCPLVGREVAGRVYSFPFIHSVNVFGATFKHQVLW